MIAGFTKKKNLLGCSLTRALPGKRDIANSGPVAVDAHKSKGEGNLGYPWAPPLNQEVDENQTESSQQGEHGPVFGAGKKK